MIKKQTLRDWKAILKIAWPLILANSFWNLQITIDRVYLSHYDMNALGAAQAVMGVFWTIMALVQQTAAYSMTFVAQYLGANRPKRIGPAVWQSIYISIFGGLATLLLIPFSDQMFAAMGHSAKLQELESVYFKALCFSALPTALIAAISGFFTGLGRSQTVMWINGVGLVFNVIFDYLLIFGNLGFPALGIEGAGYATGLASGCASIYALWLYFSKNNNERYATRSKWQFDWKLTKRFIRYGVPSGLQWALEGLAFTVFLIIVGRMPNGEAALAASGIAVTMMMLSILPALGMAQAVSALVGQHLGKDQPQRAVQDTWHGLQVAVIYIVSVGITFLVVPEFYISWFKNPENAELWNEVNHITPYLLIFVAIFTCFDAMNLVFSFTLKGAGDTRFVTLVALTLPWPLMVLPTWYVRNWGDAIYWAWGAAGIFIAVQALVFLMRFLDGKWKNMRVIEPVA